jgi:hypothetical protein
MLQIDEFDTAYAGSRFYAAADRKQPLRTQHSCEKSCDQRSGSALGLSARAIEQLRGEGMIGKVATWEESNAPAHGRVKN